MRAGKRSGVQPLTASPPVFVTQTGNIFVKNRAVLNFKSYYKNYSCFCFYYLYLAVILIINKSDRFINLQLSGGSNERFSIIVYFSLPVTILFFAGIKSRQEQDDRKFTILMRKIRNLSRKIRNFD